MMLNPHKQLAEDATMNAYYTGAQSAAANHDFNTARETYDTLLDTLNAQPADQDYSLAVALVRTNYARMNIRWAMQDDITAFRFERLHKAERDLQLAQGTISDRLSYGQNLTPADLGRLHLTAGEIANLLGRLFTAEGIVRLQGNEPPASAARDFTLAQRFYTLADRQFGQSCDRHERIHNALFAARQERLLGSRLGIRKWLARIAIESFWERQSDPHGARQTRRLLAQRRQETRTYKAAFEAVLQSP